MKAEFNRHLRDFKCDFTIEFNVKNPPIPNIPFQSAQHEYETGTVANALGDKLFKKLNYKWLEDWSFAGRSNGWFVLLCRGEESRVRERTIVKLENLVETYLEKYKDELEKAYKIEIVKIFDHGVSNNNIHDVIKDKEEIKSILENEEEWTDDLEFFDAFGNSYIADDLSRM